MKKLILGATLAVMCATGFGDVEAFANIGNNNKQTIATLDTTYTTPRGDAYFVLGCIDDMLDVAKANAAYKADVKQLQIIRRAFECIAEMKKMTNITSAITKATTAMSALTMIRNDARIIAIWDSVNNRIAQRPILRTGGDPQVEGLFNAFRAARNGAVGGVAAAAIPAYGAPAAAPAGRR